MFFGVPAGHLSVLKKLLHKGPRGMRIKRDPTVGFIRFIPRLVAYHRYASVLMSQINTFGRVGLRRTRPAGISASIRNPR